MGFAALNSELSYTAAMLSTTASCPLFLSTLDDPQPSPAVRWGRASTIVVYHNHTREAERLRAMDTIQHPLSVTFRLPTMHTPMPLEPNVSGVSTAADIPP